MISTVADLRKNQEAAARMKRYLDKYGASKSPTGLVFGVPERWLKRPQELNQADQQRLMEAIA